MTSFLRNNVRKKLGTYGGICELFSTKVTEYAVYSLDGSILVDP
jgi:hypothetical protein